MPLNLTRESLHQPLPTAPTPLQHLSPPPTRQGTEVQRPAPPTLLQRPAAPGMVGGGGGWRVGPIGWVSSKVWEAKRDSSSWFFLPGPWRSRFNSSNYEKFKLEGRCWGRVGALPFLFAGRGRVCPVPGPCVAPHPGLVAAGRSFLTNPWVQSPATPPPNTTTSTRAPPLPWSLELLL